MWVTIKNIAYSPTTLFENDWRSLVPTIKPRRHVFLRKLNTKQATTCVHFDAGSLTGWANGKERGDMFKLGQWRAARDNNRETTANRAYGTIWFCFGVFRVRWESKGGKRFVSGTALDVQFVLWIKGKVVETQKRYIFSDDWAVDWFLIIIITTQFIWRTSFWYW